MAQLRTLTLELGRLMSKLRDMVSSPLILGLKHRFIQKEGMPTGSYKVFTTAYDEVIDANDLAKFHSKLSIFDKESLEAAMSEFERSFSEERILLTEEAAKVSRELDENLSAKDRAGAVVSFAIDHSGSMKGTRMISALLAVEIAVDVLRNVNISSEIVGFTTRSWHGGKSRKAWKWAGRPANPGRVCDLRHIVYGGVNRSAAFPWIMRLSLHPSLLRENIDGEALQWAAGRLTEGDWNKRIVIQVSDGAPVDDSSLQANDEPEFLVQHLGQVRAELAAQDVVLGTLLLGGENVPEPKLFERASEPLEAGKSLLRLLRKTLIG